MVIYFSGTGNSKFCARFLAEQLNDTITNAFEQMRSHTGAELHSDTPWVFVTPTCAWQLPHIFEEFLKLSHFTGSKDAYFVMTCGSDIGNAPAKNASLCQEIGLCCKGTYEIVMPENYVAMFPVPDEEQARAVVCKAIPGLKSAAAEISSACAHSVPDPSILDKMKSGIINKAFYPLVVKDRAFTVSDRCIGCGHCALKCVMNNIRLVSDRPVWGGECTHCMACICSCPKSAIEYGKASIGKPRYQCPSIVL